MDPRLQWYHVVEFVSAPLKGRYACVPVTWVEWVTSPSIEVKVRVAYPDVDEINIHLLVQNQIARRDHWTMYMAFIKYTTGSYKDAIAFMNRLRVEGLKGCGVESEASRRSHGGDPANQQALRPVAKNLTQPSLKRSSSTDNGDYIKRFRAAQTATSMSNANIQPHVESGKIACNLSNITTASQKCPEVRHVHNENPQSPIQPSSSKTFSDQSISDEIAAEEINASFIINMRTDIINRINTYSEILMKAKNETATFNNKLPYSSILKDLLSDVQVEQTEDTEDASSEADEMTQRAPKFTLPPEYDPENSRWTLRYRTPASGLDELMPRSRIYINREGFAKCQTRSRSCASLARMLMVEIFSINALKVCSLSGTGHRKSQFDEAEPVRPGLDRHARTTILTYVEAYGRQKGWPPMWQESVKHSMRYKLNEIRTKSK